MSRAYKLVLILCIGLLFTRKAHVQEVKHAPTVEQCQADQRLWLAKLEGTSEAMPEDYRTLQGWFMEMRECKNVDPDNGRSYMNVCSEIDAELVMRLEKFLDRHGLYIQFIEEDKAGKR